MKPNLHSRTLTPVRVSEIYDITPRMRRITVTGDGLREFPVQKPAQWMKVFFPSPDNRPPSTRAYTIRQFCPSDARMEIDLVLHGDTGPAGYWAARAQVGSTLQLSMPRAGADINAATKRFVLVGDHTALPAMSAIVAALPERVQIDMFAEVPDERDEQELVTAAQLNLHWTHAGQKTPGTTGQLETQLQQASIDIADCQFWVAGESTMVKNVVAHLCNERLVPKSAIQSAGYWKLGVKGHKE